MLSPTNRLAASCVATLCACACVLVGLVAGCDDGATAPARAPEVRKLEPMPGGGVRLDMRGEGRHVRGLQRQPDGTWKSICVDAPDALRPRAGGAARDGGAP